MLPIDFLQKLMYPRYLRAFLINYSKELTLGDLTCRQPGIKDKTGLSTFSYICDFFIYKNATKWFPTKRIESENILFEHFFGFGSAYVP